jgi:large subunit ribosomal protein L7/L12
MFALLAGLPVASADRYLFQQPVAYAPTQQFAGVQQYTPAEMPQFVVDYPQVEMPQYVVDYPQVYMEEAYAADNGTSWSWVALCGMAGAAVGIAARTMFESNSSPAESDLEAGIYNQRMAMLSVGGQEAAVLSDKSSRILEDLKSMTLLEASELVKAIEETFGVDASASAGPAMMMAAPGGAAAPAEAAEEQTEFTVMLDSFAADKKIAVLKVVRNATGLGLKEAKELVEGAPKEVKAGIAKSAAEELKKEIEEAGGVVSLK